MFSIHLLTLATAAFSLGLVKGTGSESSYEGEVGDVPGIEQEINVALEPARPAVGIALVVFLTGVFPWAIRNPRRRVA